jgi:ABC-2 type transport system permease protein
MRRGQVTLVADREVRERVRSRTFKVVTAVLLLASLAGVVIPALVSDDGPARSAVAVSGGPPGLPEALVAAGRARDRDVTVQRLDAAAAAREGRSGDVDAAVIGRGATAPARVVVREELSDGLRAVIAEGLALSRVSDALGRAGTPPARVSALTRPPAIDLESAEGPGPSGGAIGLGILVSVVLYATLLFAGTLVASGVAEEKASRVSEVLLASLRPSELLAGKVIGIGAVCLGQLAVAAVPALVVALAVNRVDLPGGTASAVAAGLLWFVAGYALYSAAYGALGALVGRQQEVGQATAPLSLLLLVGYLGAAFAPGDPDAVWVQIGSWLPPFAPMMMPLRVAAGTVGWGEVVLALLLTLVASAGLIALGARVYRTGMTRGGPRIAFREAVRQAVSRTAPS